MTTTAADDWLDDPKPRYPVRLGLGLSPVAGSSYVLDEDDVGRGTPGST